MSKSISQLLEVFRANKIHLVVEVKLIKRKQECDQQKKKKSCHQQIVSAAAAAVAAKIVHVSTEELCTKARQWLSDSASRTHKFTIALTSGGATCECSSPCDRGFFSSPMWFLFPWLSHAHARTHKQIVEQKIIIIIIMCRSDEMKWKKKKKLKWENRKREISDT